MDSQLISVTGFWLFVILLTILIILAISYAKRETWKTTRRENSLKEIEQSRIGQTSKSGTSRIVVSKALKDNEVVVSKYSNLIIVSPEVYEKLQKPNSFKG